MKKVIDISYYQDPELINYDVLLDQVNNKQVDGVIVRLGYGVGAKDWVGKPDPAFERHYAECKKRNIPVGAYHYMVEYATVDAQLSIVKRALDGKHFELGFWADVELEGGAPPLTRATVIEYISKIEAYLGKKIGIYTGAWCWNPIMGNDNPYSSRRLWVASYSSSPYLPIGWNEYDIWQYTSSGRLDGYPKNLDMNTVPEEVWIELVEKDDNLPDIITPLDVPLFSQKDTRWSSERLGTSSVTIGAYGCLLTASAMICKYFGKETDPSRLNKALIEVNGYESGNLLRYNAITTIYPDIIVRWNYFLSNPGDAIIDEILMQELPVISQVDYNPATSALDQHWVLIVGKENGQYLIVDPIDGSTSYLSRYANKVFRIAVFEQQKAEEVLFRARVLANALNVRNTPVYYADGRNIVGLLKKDEVVNVYEVNPPNGWFRIGVDRWCSGSEEYMERIEVEPPQPPEPPMTLEEQVKDNTRRIEKIEEEIK